MSSFGVVQIGDVFAMLDKCAPGHTKRPTEHHYCIRWNGRTFPSLPLGEHGRKRQTLRVEIKMGVVKKMIKHLEIPLACAAEVIAGLETPTLKT